MSLSAYLQLEGRFKRILTFKGIAQILRWDAEVAMPKGSARVRGEQLAALDAEIHALLTDSSTGRWLARVESAWMQLDDWQQSNARLMRRMWLRAGAVQKSLVAALGKAEAEGEGLWVRARAENDFSLLAPHLEKIIGLVRRKSEALADKLQCSPYDALLDEHDPGRHSREVDPLFAQLKKSLPTLVQTILEHQVGHEPRPLAEDISIGRQKQLARRLMQAMGFPFHQGRLDTSEHPFTEGPPGDIRVTTRYETGNVLSGLMGVLHETGHALYDFGLPPLWLHQPVGRDGGMTVHEGQALFWEMMIGRSRPFMEWIAQAMRRRFAVDGPEWSGENLYHHATLVRPGPIRMDADEVTYGVHILLRYELEKNLLSGKLKVKDLPEAWNARMQKDLGLSPQSLSEGCLQDIHWAQGYFGYFSTYLLGALMAAQLFAVLEKNQPQITNEIGEGNFGSVLNWLRINIHNQGSRYNSQELLKRICGSGLQVKPYLAYLQHKYQVPVNQT